MAHAGWDSLVVDMQHGMIDYQMMVTMLQGISTTDTTPMVRVPWNDPAHIQKALDAGAYGIVCPMINNRAEAEKFVGSMGYAPGGDKPDEWMMTALKKVLDGCKRHKVQPGIHCGAPAYAKKMIEMGFTFVTVGGDTRFVTMGGQGAVAEMRSSGPARSAPGSTSPY
jgi:2-keto-3-deoxy-L-rhamnonate aldolase RhmA